MNIMLRKMVLSDIEDNVRWFTEETEWTVSGASAEAWLCERCKKIVIEY